MDATSDQSDKPRRHTLECHCCGERKPRDGFHFLANRYVSICPDCWPDVEPYRSDIERMQRDVNETGGKWIVSFIKKAVEQARSGHSAIDQARAEPAGQPA